MPAGRRRQLAVEGELYLGKSKAVSRWHERQFINGTGWSLGSLTLAAPLERLAEFGRTPIEIGVAGLGQAFLDASGFVRHLPYAI